MIDFALERIVTAEAAAAAAAGAGAGAGAGVKESVEAAEYEYGYPPAQDKPVLAYLVHHHVRGLVQRFAPLHALEPCFVRHADDKGDQIMARGVEITGIIDWEWCVASRRVVSCLPLAKSSSCW
jgi:hypothetical protein